MRIPTTALACAALLLSIGAAQAQGAAAPAPPATAPGKPAAKKVASFKPASSVTITNASKQTATQVSISADDQTAKTSKPLAPKARTVLKLPKLKGCMVSVAATFTGEGEVDVGEFDICKDRTIRFTD